MVRVKWKLEDHGKKSEISQRKCLNVNLTKAHEF